MKPKTIELKKKKKEKYQASLDELCKLVLISQTCNSLYYRPNLN
jgi:hypothetical protein